MTQLQKTIFSRQYVIKAAGWLILFLIILEMFVRFFIIQIPPKQYIDGLGLVPADNSRKIWGLEGWGVTHYVQGGEVYTPYQTGLPIVVLGDSYTEGYQVNDAEKYVSIAEELLQARGVNVDLRNLGYSDRSVADYIYAAPYILHTYAPEMIIIQLNSYNFAASLIPSRVNYFVEEGSTMVLKHRVENLDLKWQQIIRQFGLGSFFAYRFDAVKKSFVHRMNSFKTGQMVAESNNIEEYKDFGNLAQQLKILQDAYKDTRLVILLIPSLPVADQNGAILWIDDRDQLLLQVLGDTASPFLYPKQSFISLYYDEKKFPRGFFNTSANYGHLNADGNRVLGNALADYLIGVLK